MGSVVPEALSSSGSGKVGGGDGEVITAADVFSMAEKRDEVAMGVVEETCAYLGLACLNICRLLDPDAILLTGGMSNAEGLVDKVRAVFGVAVGGSGGSGVACFAGMERSGLC